MNRVGSVLAAAALLAGVLTLLDSAPAQAAEPARARSGAEFAADAPWSRPPPQNKLQWDAKGRWGLRLDMHQPWNREADLKDVQAGAYFRITPSLQVGGAVSLGDRLSNPKQVTPQDAVPRVHLETAFRF